MKYKVTLNGKTYEVEVEAGKAILLDEYEALAPAAPAAAPVQTAPAAAAPAAPAPVNKELPTKVLGEGGVPVDCRDEDKKRTGEEFKDAAAALGDLARSEEDLMSYICFPDQTVKYLENRKAQEENEAVYTIEEM